MNSIMPSLYKFKILYFVLSIGIFSVESFNQQFSKINHSYNREDKAPLFMGTQFWNPGDIPLLNRKVFKGMRVTIREHPYVASIRRDIMHYSVATMLTKNIFITVAHPLVDVPLDELAVVVGENYADRGASLLTVIILIFHENFDKYTLKADLALIRVYEDTSFRCSVKPIQLIEPPSHLDYQTAFVTGWGRCDRTGKELCLPRSSRFTPGELFDPMLRTISFIIREPNYYCEGYNRNGVHLLSGMICMGPAREEDKVAPCMAVPGAPAVVKARLVGLQSWGYGCGYDYDLPLIYTSVQYYQPWILHNIPVLRKITQKEVRILFEAKRAYILSKWFYKTRVNPPPSPNISDKTLEPLPVDKELAMLRGNVYDIRDILFNASQHKHKKRLIDKIRKKIEEKDFCTKKTFNETRETSGPFLNPNFTKKPGKHNKIKVEEEMLFIDELDKDSDSDQSYGEYDYV